MARIRRRKIEISQAQLVAFFDATPRRVYNHTALQEVLNRDLRQLVGVTLTTDQLIDFLTKNAFLKTLEIGRSTHPETPFTRYVWRDASPYEVALSLASRAYLCHGTAVMMHGLTDALPKTIYVNREQTPKGPTDRDGLAQANINRAFASKQRETTYFCTWDSWRAALLSGKNTGRLEVSSLEFNGVKVPVTKIERTLIDIAVRPTYAGGVYQVLEAYRRSLGRASIGTLLATLKTLDYAYPYHQTIGFYLERAGYAPVDYERFRALGLTYDFFLAHDIRDREYVKEWRLHIPNGL